MDYRDEKAIPKWFGFISGCVKSFERLSLEQACNKAELLAILQQPASDWCGSCFMAGQGLGQVQTPELIMHDDRQTPNFSEKTSAGLL